MRFTRYRRPFALCVCATFCFAVAAHARAPEQQLPGLFFCGAADVLKGAPAYPLVGADSVTTSAPFSQGWATPGFGRMV